MVLAAYLRSQGARVWTYFGGMQSNPQTLQEFRSLPLSSPKDGVPVPHVLLATMCLGVGVNIPECRNVMWIAGGPMSSSLKRQADGRVRRPLVQKIHQWRSFTFHARNGKHGRTSDDWARDVRLMKSIAMRPLVEMMNACVEEDGLDLNERLKLVEAPKDSETEGAWKNARVGNVQTPAYTSITYYNGEDVEAQAVSRRQAYAMAMASQTKPTEKEKKEVEEAYAAEEKQRKLRDAALGIRKILIRLPTYKPKKATNTTPSATKLKHETKLEPEPTVRASTIQSQPKRCKRKISKFSRPLLWAQMRRYEGSCRHGCLEGQCKHTICLHGLRKHVCRQCRGKIENKRKGKQRKSATKGSLKRRAPHTSSATKTTRSPTKRKKTRPKYEAPSALKASASTVRKQPRANAVATSPPAITTTTTTPTPRVSKADPNDNRHRRLRGTVSADLAAMVRSRVLTFEQATAMMSGDIDEKDAVDGDFEAEFDNIYEGLSSDLVELVKARELTLAQAQAMQPRVTPVLEVDLTGLEAISTGTEPKAQSTASFSDQSDINQGELQVAKETDVVSRWGWSSN